MEAVVTHDLLPCGSASVNGVAILNSHIYVLCISFKSVRCYEEQFPFEMINELQLQPIACPVDMASSCRSNCLFITDQQRRCIWKVSTASSMLPGDKEWLKDITDPFTLSVTGDDHLLTIRVSQPRSSLELYDRNAVMVHCIELPDYVRRPVQHAAQMTNGNFVILHSWLGGEGERTWGVSEVTTKGQTVHRFIPGEMTLAQQLRDPRCLCVGSDGRVFVADFWNDRVIVLKQDLDWNETFLSKHKDHLEMPWRMTFNKQLNQLIVVASHPPTEPKPYHYYCVIGIHHLKTVV